MSGNPFFFEMSSRPLDRKLELDRLCQYLATDPDNLKLLADIVDLSVATGDISNARSSISRALSLSPNNPYFRSRLSSVALFEQKWDEAIDICEALIEEGNDDAAILYNLGRGLLFAQRYAEAASQFQDLVVLKEVPADTIQLLIRSLHSSGNTSAALSAAAAHLEVHEDDHAVAGMLGLLYIDANDFAAAEYWGKKALQKNPGDLDALAAIGTVQLKDEDPKGAVETFEKILSIRPTNGRALVGKAMARMLELDIDGARKDFEQAVKSMPTHIGTWLGLAWTQILMGDVAAAETSAAKALALDRNFGESHGTMAAVAALKGEVEAAKGLIKTATRLNPRNASAPLAESIMLQRSGQHHSADKVLTKLLHNHQASGGGSLADMLLRVTSRNQAKH